MKIFLIKSFLAVLLMVIYIAPSFSVHGADDCDPQKDIMLNINVPFVGRCIKKDVTVTVTNAENGNSTIGNVFPKLVGGLIRLVMTAIYIIGFLGILLGGFMITGNGALGTKETGKKFIV
ncbi:MAG: hypothetical protein Q8O99_08390 [bacterium]|nr:hypothetical protein [bacterium]